MSSSGAAIAMPALLTSASSRSSSSEGGSVTSRITSVVPGGASPGFRTPACTSHPFETSRVAHAAPIPEDAPVIRTVLAKERRGELGPLRGGEAVERLDPLGALVVAVEWVLPGEADPSVHLDRALARGDCRLRGVGL